MSKQRSSTPSALILQRILPPYRIPLFQSLSDSKSCRIDVVYGMPSHASALESRADVPGIHAQPLNNSYIGRNEALVVQTGVRRLLISGRYDTLIAEFNPRILTNLLAAMQAKRLGMNLIWWGHGLRPQTTKTAARIYKALARRADALIFYNGEAARQFASFGIPAEKLFVAWNSIDTTEIESLRADVPPQDRWRILSVSRLIPEKKVSLLIRAFALASRMAPAAANLTIVGDGPERAALLSLARQLKIEDRVEFVGSQYAQNQLARYFNSAWVCVCPGYVGLNAIQGLAFGVPMIVADDEPHSPEFCAVEPDVNSLLFHANDPQHLGGQIVKLAGDAALRERMSIAAKQTVKDRFSIELMTRVFEDAICYVNDKQRRT